MKAFVFIVSTFLMTFSALDCGAEDVSARANISLSWPVFSSTDVLKVFVLAPQRSDGADLKCAALSNQQPALDDSSLEIYAQSSARAAELESGAIDLVLDKIPAGEGRIFVAEVRDSSNQRVGFGCTEGVSISANNATDVNLSISEL